MQTRYVSDIKYTKLYPERNAKFGRKGIEVIFKSLEFLGQTNPMDHGTESRLLAKRSERLTENSSAFGKARQVANRWESVAQKSDFFSIITKNLKSQPYVICLLLKSNTLKLSHWHMWSNSYVSGDSVFLFSQICLVSKWCHQALAWELNQSFPTPLKVQICKNSTLVVFGLHSLVVMLDGLLWLILFSVCVLDSLIHRRVQKDIWKAFQD